MNQKEVFLNNSHVGMSVSNATRVLDSATSPAPASDAPPAVYDSPTLNSDNTASYVQVVVQKHRRSRPSQYVETERVARASSPLPTVAERACNPTVRDAATRTEAIRYPAFSCAGLGINNNGCAVSEKMRASGDGRAMQSTYNPYMNPSDEFDSAKPTPPSVSNNQKEPMWKELECQTNGLEWEDNGPECLAIYYFERGNDEFLCACASSNRPLPCVERTVRRFARQCSWLLAELLSTPRLAIALPLYSLIEFERWSLTVVRGAICGSVQTAGDYLLKPALAVTFNSLVRPPLVFLANVMTALRDGIRPLWQILGDAMEPPARLLKALSLVQVNVYSTPPQGHVQV